MSKKTRLPADAFGYYLSLGAGRSYDAVAKHYGVSRRTVASRAASESWQERMEAVEKEARAGADAKAAELMRQEHSEHLAYVGQLQVGIRSVLTPERMRAMVAMLIKVAVKKEDVQAARLLFDRVLGKPRTEPLQGGAVDIPAGLQSASDIVAVANVLLQAVADGSLSPEDAQRSSSLVESARKAIETEELAERLKAVEDELKRRGHR